MEEIELLHIELLIREGNDTNNTKYIIIVD